VRGVFIVLVVFACIYWIASLSSEQSGVQTKQHVEGAGATFHGHDCTVDCSGHEAGLNWAEEHGITDGDDCDTAGEHSNSPSFAERCHAYVDDQSSPDDETEGPSSSGDEEED
jgi:hypothetical protein